MESQPQRQVNSIQQVLAKAEHFMNSDRADLATKTLRRGLGEYPESARLYGLLAITLMNQDLLTESREALDQALRHDPEDMNAHFCLGRIAIIQGHHTAAEQHLLDGLAIDPNNEIFMVEYARLMYLTDNLKKASRLLERALAINPEHAGAQSLRADVQARLLRFNEAEDHRSRALKVDPDSALVHYRLGCSMLQSGRPFRARRHLREALRISPDVTGIEEQFLHADFCCRWLYLPKYYWSLLLQRLPGRQFGFYLIFIAIVFLSPKLGAPSLFVTIFVFGYLGFCAYTWVADPLTKLWIKWRPPS